MKRGYIFISLAIGFIILLLLRSHNFSIDSLPYALSISKGENLYHPHHILYNPIVHYLTNFLQLFWEGFHALLVAQIYGALLGVGTCYFLYRLLNHFQFSERTSLIATLALFLSWGFFRFSTQIEVYIGTLFFSASLFYYLFRLDEHISWKNLVQLSFLWLLAIGHHQFSVLLIFPISTFFLMKETQKKALLHLLQLCIFAGLPTLLIYLLAAGKRDFITFILGYASNEAMSAGSFANYDLKGINALMIGQLSNFISHSLASLAAFTIPFYLFFVYTITYNVIALRKKARLHTERWTLLVWLVSHYLFILWWAPKEGEFYVVSLFPLIMLALLAAKEHTSSTKYKKQLRRIYDSIPVLLIIFNSYFIYQNHFHRPTAYNQAQSLGNHFGEDCRILVTAPVDAYLEYYFNVRPLYFNHLVQQLLYEPKKIDRNKLQQESCIVLPVEHLEKILFFNNFTIAEQKKHWKSLMSLLFTEKIKEEELIMKQVKIEYVDALPVFNIRTGGKAHTSMEEYLSSLHQLLKTEGINTEQSFDKYQ